jgi:DNA-binding NarL/FixJ family response regulator
VSVQIRVSVVDDYPLVRGGIATALESDPGITVVAQAGTAGEAIAQAVDVKPDVVLMDLGLPDTDGIAAIQRLTEEVPDSRVLVITANENVELLSEAMAAGARGYLTKRATARELCGAVITVHGGGTVIDSMLAAQVFQSVNVGQGSTGTPRPMLTTREREVLRLVAEGLTDKEIADALFISPRTVQHQLISIRQKTGLGRRSELAHWAATHLSR